MHLSLAVLPNAFQVRHGIPHPNWEAIAELVDGRTAELNNEQLNETWAEIARQWLDVLRASLPSEYVVLESPEFFVLAAAGGPAGERILHWCEHFRRTILDSLPGVAKEEGFGKQVVLAFDNDEAFYNYICDFDPEEGDFGAIGGMFLDRGYGHIVVNAQVDYGLDRTIAHELTHAMLRHLSFPLWLNEGVTQVVEDIAVGSSQFLMTPELAKRHREYWNESTIDAFWSGDAFRFADDGQELSYSLAQVLVLNLMSDFPRKIVDFIRTAEYSDAGDQALQDTCGINLTERVAQFLGPGPWQPRADYWE